MNLIKFDTKPIDVVYVPELPVIVVDVEKDKPEVDSYVTVIESST